jgi:hypothetical protein
MQGFWQADFRDFVLATIKARKNRPVWAETAGFGSSSKIGLTAVYSDIILTGSIRSETANNCWSRKWTKTRLSLRV